MFGCKKDQIGGMAADVNFESSLVLVKVDLQHFVLTYSKDKVIGSGKQNYEVGFPIVFSVVKI